jgi:hypothetical protein
MPFAQSCTQYFLDRPLDWGILSYERLHQQFLERGAALIFQLGSRCVRPLLLTLGFGLTGFD